MPTRLRVARSLGQRPCLHRRGDELRAETGYALPGQPALARIGHVRIAPILQAFADESDRNRAVTLAGQDRALFALGPKLVQLAVDELFVRGLLMAAP